MKKIGKYPGYTLVRLRDQATGHMWNIDKPIETLRDLEILHGRAAFSMVMMWCFYIALLLFAAFTGLNRIVSGEWVASGPVMVASTVGLLAFGLRACLGMSHSDWRDLLEIEEELSDFDRLVEQFERDYTADSDYKEPRPFWGCTRFQFKIGLNGRLEDLAYLIWRQKGNSPTVEKNRRVLEERFKRLYDLATYFEVEVHKDPETYMNQVKLRAIDQDGWASRHGDHKKKAPEPDHQPPPVADYC